MLTSRLILSLALSSLLLAAPGLAQERDDTLPRLSPNAAASFQLGVTEIEVTYGAPSVRDRTIFGGLVPYDEVWRLGANEATSISFSTDVLVQGQALQAGTYMMAAVPGADSWTIIFNQEPEQWGVYEYDPDRDVLRVDVSPQSARMRETMTFSFDNAELTGDRDAVDLILHWADVEVPVRLTTETGRHVEARAAAAIGEDDWRRPLTFARYALQSGHHMDKALEWVDAAVLHQESYSTLALRARIQAARGDRAGAAETGARALVLADAMAEPPANAATLREEVEGWQQQR